MGKGRVQDRGQSSKHVGKFPDYWPTGMGFRATKLYTDGGYFVSIHYGKPKMFYAWLARSQVPKGLRHLLLRVKSAVPMEAAECKNLENARKLAQGITLRYKEMIHERRTARGST